MVVKATTAKVAAVVKAVAAVRVAAAGLRLDLTGELDHDETFKAALGCLQRPTI